MPKKPAPMLDRFLQKVEMVPIAGCWLWNGSTDGRGYGAISTKRGNAPKKAHRVAYELFVGPIEAEKVVRHQCDTPSCVNPNHLSIGTQKDNVHDTVRRNRLNPISFMNLQPGEKGFYGAGPNTRKENSNGILK